MGNDAAVGETVLFVELFRGEIMLPRSQSANIPSTILVKTLIPDFFVVVTDAGVATTGAPQCGQDLASELTDLLHS